MKFGLINGYIFFLLSISSLTLKSQAPTFQWSKNFDGGQSTAAESIAVDVLGNVYTTGVFQGTVDFDPGSATYTMVSNSPNWENSFVSKLDAQGNFLWAKKISGPQNDAIGITRDSQNNLFITGYFIGVTDFDPGPGTYTLPTTSFNVTAFILKLDSNGNFMWARSFGSLTNSQSVFGQKSAIDNSGNPLIVGYFQDVVDFDPGPGVYNLTAAGIADIFICKLDAAGNFMWAKQMGGTTDDRGFSINLDYSGNIYTTGFFKGTADFDPGPGTYTLATVMNFGDIFVSKLDPVGNFLWARQMGGSSNDYGTSITTDKLGNVITTGFFMGTGDFDPGTSSFSLTADGATDIFVSKLSSTGNFIWALQMGGIDQDDGSMVNVDTLTNVYVCGYFRDTVDFDPGVGTYTLVSAGDADAYISKFTPGGNFIWTLQTGGSGSDGCYAIDINDQGTIHAAGTYTGIVDFNPGPGTFTLTSSVGPDAYIQKFNQCLTPPSPPLNTTPLINLTICNGLSTTLTASSNGTINWYASTTSTTILSTGTNYLTPTLAIGSYTYYAESVTCTNSPVRTAIVLTVSSCNSISEITNSNSDLELFPNPFTSKVIIKNTNKAPIQIFSSLGVLIREANSVIRDMEIDLSEMPDGVYFVKNGSVTKKIIKQN